MQPSGHSSLPQRPQWTQQQQQPYYPNPYLQQNAYSSHYAQAYLQSQLPSHPSTSSHPVPARPNTNDNSRPRHGSQPTGAWYQTGNKRCTYKDCRFTGSHKAVELHMMDRHLIYPPGWEKRPKKEEWLADPSLKGKPIPIQGTNILLDSPETLEAWIVERRKRFPTADRVEDKKRKMEEAISRGQLTAEDMGVRSVKRRRTDEPNSRPGPGKGNQNNRGNKRGHQMPKHRPPPVTEQETPVKVNPSPAVADETGSSDDDDSNDEPEVFTSKASPSTLESLPPPSSRALEKSTPSTNVPTETVPTKSRPQRPLQPKRPIQNPFDMRQPLLRNLILPEIRVTVSNLSQAIRFLVDNDFLRNVELKPGQAAEQPIQVISSQQTKSEPREV